MCLLGRDDKYLDPLLSSVDREVLLIGIVKCLLKRKRIFRILRRLQVEKATFSFECWGCEMEV